ncbi:MAG: PspC domain-containing protein [Methanocorpusculum parvum]|nr:PspC domain-containing protein [Methanocorpusculum parvum]
MAKKLTRSPTHRLIGGVCGGIADYGGISPWIIRLIFIIVFILPIPFSRFVVLAAYIVLWIALPLGTSRKQLDPNTIDAEFEVKE